VSFLFCTLGLVVLVVCAWPGKAGRWAAKFQYAYECELVRLHRERGKGGR